jgi:TonB-linked SusC/RagA family outer membrane protein
MRRILLISFMLMSALISDAWAQRTVSGTVTSGADGEGLPGVAVRAKGTSTGVTTDFEGNYRLEVPEGVNTLVFSFVGFAPQEIPIGNRSVIDVELAEDVKQLEEVVVTALGFEVKKDNIGIASSTVEGDAVAKSGESTLLQGLAGKAAGVNITQGSGDPGAGSRIVIRGATSITGDLDPLIVIDGVPMFNDQVQGAGSNSTGSGGGVTQQSRLNDINPNDIESMEILKGASAAALWGARAANGVIIITTKKGRSALGKKFTIDVTSRVSLDRLNREVPLSYEYGQGFLGRFNGGYGTNFGQALSWGDRISDRPGGQDTYITDPNAEGYLGYFEAQDGTRYYAIPAGTPENPHGGKNDRTVYNPHDQLFRTGQTLYNSVGVGTADENGNVYISVSNQDQNGIILENSNYNRLTGRLSATRYLGDKVTLTTAANYTGTSGDRVQMGSNLSGLFLGGLRSSPGFNMEDYVGTYVDPEGNVFENRQRSYRNPLGRRPYSVYDNPLWSMRNNRSTTEVDRVIGKVELNVNPVKWLNIISRVGLDRYTDEREDFFDPLSANFQGGAYTKQTIIRSQINADLIAQTNYSFGNSISGNFLVGTSLNDRDFSTAGAQITNFTNPLSPPDLGNAPSDARSTFSQESEVRNFAYFTSASIGFVDQVFLNLSGRYDAFSTLPAGERGFFYPAADIAWQFTELIAENNILSFGKLRGGYGEVGRAPDPYITETFFVPSSYTEGWGGVLDASQYGGGFRRSSLAGNPDIRPETKKEWEIGADLRFIKDRISLNATYYDNVTEDLIIPIDLPASSGFGSITTNAAEIENKGIELELTGRAVASDNFTWDINLNWSRNRNLVTDLAGVEEISLGGFTGSTSSAVEGQPLGVIWGDATLRDENGNLVLTEAGFPQLAPSPQVLGDPNPDWRGGLGTTLSYKGFSLNAWLESSQGGDVWNGTRGALAFFGKAAMTARTTTLTTDEANTVLNYAGLTAAELYPHWQNADGTYTVRGYVTDFGGGPVLIDELYYRSGPGSGFTGPADQFVEDGSWTRFRELTLSYDFSRLDFISRLGLSSANLSLTGRNLFLWTDYQGIDPDTNLTGASNALGLDYFNNPATRSYVVTLNLKY